MEINPASRFARVTGRVDGTTAAVQAKRCLRFVPLPMFTGGKAGFPALWERWVSPTLRLAADAMTPSVTPPEPARAGASFNRIERLRAE